MNAIPEEAWKPISFDEAMKVYDEKPTEVKPDDVKPLSIEDAKKVVARD